MIQTLILFPPKADDLFVTVSFKAPLLFPSLEENFREAKRLKMVIDELWKAGEVLCRYEVEKKEAISREDFDTARIKKVNEATPLY